MAKGPTTVAGVHPLSDLLFSPRAAFIWNHTRKSVAWINPAARAAFALRLEDFSASLPPSLIRRFGQFTERKEGGTAKVKLAGGPNLNCSVEILKLADGQDGLIVAEAGESEVRIPAQAPSRRTAAAPKKSVRKAPSGTARPRRKSPKTPPALTDEEMRAFKAVGRKVLRLCKEKNHLPPAAAPLPVAPAPSPFGAGALSPDRSAQALADVLTVFDLVLFLGENLDIVRLQGRAPRLGWRKAKLAGKTAGDLLLPFDQAILRRMCKRLSGQASKSSRDTLVVQREDGTGVPCRAVLGHWGEGGVAYFLALLSLELPARLKRPQPVNAVAASRLAA